MQLEYANIQHDVGCPSNSSTSSPRIIAAVDDNPNNTRANTSTEVADEEDEKPFVYNNGNVSLDGTKDFSLAHIQRVSDSLKAAQEEKHKREVEAKELESELLDLLAELGRSSAAYEHFLNGADR